MVAPAIEQPDLNTCDECGSTYVAAASRMESLCPECAHWLYGYPACNHEMLNGHCSRCGWDGSHSVYVEKVKAETEDSAETPEPGSEEE